jgi:hypothetical protein
MTLNVRCFLDSGSRTAYIDHYEDPTAEDESHEKIAMPSQPRRCKYFGWEKSWQGSARRALKGCLANAIFHPLAYAPKNGTTTIHLYVLTYLPPSIAI